MLHVEHLTRNYIVMLSFMVMINDNAAHIVPVNCSLCAMGIMALTRLVLTVFIFVKYEEADAAKKGYDVQFEKLEKCEGTESDKMQYLTRIQSIGGGAYTYSSPFYLGVPVDDDLKIEFDLQKVHTRGYRTCMRKTFGNCKEFWEIFQNVIKGFFQAAGVEITSCPIPMGNYTVENYVIEPKLNVPVVPLGKYRAFVKAYYKQEEVTCFIMYAEAVPKTR